jgi:4a-hydroxytetrahydrobiopterin dehydratase
MGTLVQERCQACDAGAPSLTDGELKTLMPQIPDWRVVEREGMKRLERTFKVKNFVRALELTNMVGDLAEQEGHHPAILTEWGRVTVTWWTHKIAGLHRNDVVMAAKTDQLASQLEASAS